MRNNSIWICVLLAVVVTASAERFFPDDSVWFKDVSNAALDPESDDIIQWLVNAGGWGNGNKFQVDLSMHILRANENTPKVPVVHADGYYIPDCDTTYDKIPLPNSGAIEGQTGYTCDVTSDDCHLLIVDEYNGLMYEAYQATVIAGQLHTGCLIVWDSCTTYPMNGRGEQCSSADAAGFPIAQLLFTPDEIVAGEIDHAIRFILPNDKMRADTYVHPASHAGSPRATGPAPIYGARFRLKQNFDDSSYGTAAKVVIKALKKYGMLLSDGGNIVLTGTSDMFTEHKWSETDFDTKVLFGIEASDFEVVDGGERIELTYDCVRNEIPLETCPKNPGQNFGAVISPMIWISVLAAILAL